jgi:protein yorkie
VNKKKNLIILVDKDSNDKLNELFDKTLSNKLPLQIPYRMRKLPDSFFKPPSSGSKSPSVSHSRENSADSAFGSGTTIHGGIPTAHNGLPVRKSVLDFFGILFQRFLSVTDSPFKSAQ